MTDLQKEFIATRELKDISKFEYIVYTDAEYYNIPYDLEDELDLKYSSISICGFVIYYKPLLSK